MQNDALIRLYEERQEARDALDAHWQKLRMYHLRPDAAGWTGTEDYTPEWRKLHDELKTTLEAAEQMIIDYRGLRR